jgi:5-oxoprolinase (ATP-hydrolysing)
VNENKSIKSISYEGKWQFWIDRGGTFTDVVARRPDGTLACEKLLSENPGQYEDAAIEGLRRLLGLAGDDPVPAEAVAAVKMGTTVATNALLERAGAPTLLVTNQGFGDALAIGYQNRPDLFALHIRLPERLYGRVLEVAGRLDATGAEIQPLDEPAAAEGLAAAYGAGFRAVAIVLMHSYRAPEHERGIAALAEAAGFTQISVSSEVSPLMKLVSRGDTTVVDAYLSPILKSYIGRVAKSLGGIKLMFMQSNGGLTDAQLFRGKDSILSGPAGGVVGAAGTAAMAGFNKIIGFDMGGTSTDVSHYAGEFERAFDTEVAGVRLRSPIMRIHTVAAGGGSILQFDGARMRVGPGSAGADPGPACYGGGGPLTITDANVMLGRIQPRHFPHVFGPRADQPLDAEISNLKFAELAVEIAVATGTEQTAEAVAEGFLIIAVENMAGAIKRISVQRGYDVTEYTLVCFGGAGGQHACRVADALGMESIFIHPLAGVLSAYGMGLAEVHAHRERAVETEMTTGALSDLEPVFADLEDQSRAELAEQNIAAEQIQVHRRLHIRYAGTDTALEVPFGPLDKVSAEFESAHRARFGFIDPGRGLIIEAAFVEAVGGAERAHDGAMELGPASGAPIETATTHMAGSACATPIYRRGDLLAETQLDGPAIIIDDTGTTVIDPEWAARVSGPGHLILTRTKPRPAQAAIGAAADPVMLEVFNNLFMSIAEQMGAVLANTASSVNIKERLDFSCALFDGGGALIANAPHLPVHLGSMGESIHTVIRQRAGTMKPGEVYALNAPYNGGTHLPDITVITPVFDASGTDILFFLGSRGHHADVGGITPGSIPPFSRDIAEEGVLIDDFLLVSDDRLAEAELRQLLASGAHPARNPDQNIADFKAQIAANEKGAAELARMAEHFTLPVVEAYMRHVRANAAEQVRRVLDVLPDGEFTSAMDNGAQIQVAIRVDKQKRRAVIDFTGTSVQDAGNFNAPAAVSRAAVLYVFRCLVADDIPLNDGCLEPIEIIIPEGTILNPLPPAAVVAGNVETSQTVTGALMAAAGALASAQGTMNNFTFGNGIHQYYETVCGGAGAGPGFDGASAVHTHMTNTRLTDPEILEFRHPVRLEEFRIRTGSGGAGQSTGGDGTVRRVRFLEPMTAAIVSSSRKVPPFGLQGGDDGLVGHNFVERADGTRDALAGADQAEMASGDVFVIETPGGGGFGKKIP